MLFVFLAGSCSCYAQSTDSIVQAAQTKYQSIRSHLKNYDTITREGWDESTEGQQITGYYKMKDLKVIETFSYYEMGKYELQLYFDNGLLFFAQENRHIYNRPIYWDKIHMLKNKDTATHDPKKTVIGREKYYFYDGILIRWIDTDEKEVDLSLGTNIYFGEYLVAYARKLRDKLEK